uniref:Src homology 2 domain containing transforming protein D n=1 Tax=Taeniopygia guttata TaxID=59729 RepID=A0A674HU03_TAEGU
MECLGAPWCGWVPHGMVGCPMAWLGPPWCGWVPHGVVGCPMAWLGPPWCIIVPHGMVGCPMTCLGAPWCGWVPHGMVGSPMTCLGAPWHGWVPHGVVWSPMAWLGTPCHGCPSDSLGCQRPDCLHAVEGAPRHRRSLWGVGGSPSRSGCPALLTGPSSREGARWHRGCPCDPAVPRWYHGPIGRAGAETLLALCREGSFLVRDCETSPDDYSLSLRSSQGFVHVKLTRTREQHFTLGRAGAAFPSVPAAVGHYTARALPVRGARHLSLLYPVAVQPL